MRREIEREEGNKGTLGGDWEMKKPKRKRQTYKAFSITSVGILFVSMSQHYCQNDGSCLCGWKPESKAEYPDNLHMAHLARVVAAEIKALPAHREA